MNSVLHALRVLLGAVMVITALQYFLPFLLGSLPTATWDEPMAARLMAAFDKSGLLAVAKFIHLAGGALLLSNRAVPFALAALLPVNLCGTLIAVFIQAEPLVALLAVLTIALNGLLMLAYLPSYDGVLRGGQLADGEAPEPGSNYESLYANPLSNAPAKAYLGGAVVLAAALAFYWFAVPGLNGTTGVITLAIPAVLLAAGWVRALTRKA